jgi:DNA-binding transcriptional ArsR family regulator
VLSDSPVRALLTSPRRLEILRLTWEAERQAGDIRRAMPDVTWGAVSLQIGSLVAAGLLNARVAGRERFYRANRERLAPISALLEQTWNDALWRLKLTAELEATRRGPRPARPRRKPPRRTSADRRKRSRR